MILDLTHTVHPEMPVYPGSAQPSFSPASTITRNGYRETLVQIPSHTGTHMDAPSHMLPHGHTLDQLHPSQFCGRAVVVDVSDLPPNSIITVDELRKRNNELLQTDFVLFYTGWDKKWGTDDYFDDSFPVPDE